MSKTHILKPILKWVGGKTQILDKLMVEFPKNIKNYHEIFLGGGSVLFAFLSYVKEGIIIVDENIYAYDLNKPLIYVYKNIQSNHTELYHKLVEFIEEYKKCEGATINRKPTTKLEALQSKENYYYWTRIQYNQLSDEEKTTILGSAMFIFLNKTCFRGIFRVGPNGFNVPYGHYDSPEIINKEHLNEIHELIQGVIFESCDFNVSLNNNIKEGDYVYMDPPYASTEEAITTIKTKTKTKSFVGYTTTGFELEHHTSLFHLCDKLNDKQIKIMISNADVKLVRDHFPIDKYNIQSIMCKRTINSKNPDSKAKEVIITNYI